MKKRKLETIQKWLAATEIRTQKVYTKDLFNYAFQFDYNNDKLFLLRCASNKHINVHGEKYIEITDYK